LVQSQPQANSSPDWISVTKKGWQTGQAGQVVERLPSKCEALEFKVSIWISVYQVGYQMLYLTFFFFFLVKTIVMGQGGVSWGGEDGGE
jgi:hypothetical protein